MGSESSNEATGGPLVVVDLISALILLLMILITGLWVWFI